MLGDSKTLRNVLVLGLLAAGIECARADQLDKTSCKQLQSELAYVIATGARDDMAQGPEWAKTNLPLERLQNIKKLIELEEQLEFRCNMQHNSVVAVAPKQRPVIPDLPERKSNLANGSTNSTTVVEEPSAPSSAKLAGAVSGKIAKGEAEVVKERAEAADDEVKMDIKTVRGATNTVGTAAKKAATPAAATPPKAASSASRRATKNAYVPPSEVNPFFVTRYGTPR